MLLITFLTIYGNLSYTARRVVGNRHERAENKNYNNKIISL
nr:MAG TPA_asm: hypothetical protein [Caudoviricetes sp.]